MVRGDVQAQGLRRRYPPCRLSIFVFSVSPHKQAFRCSLGSHLCVENTVYLICTGIAPQSCAHHMWCLCGAICAIHFAWLKSHQQKNGAGPFRIWIALHGYTHPCDAILAITLCFAICFGVLLFNSDTCSRSHGCHTIAMRCGKCTGFSAFPASHQCAPKW